MPRKKKVIPEYGTCIRKGIEYYRTRIVDSDGKRVSLYARTPEELYEKVQEAERLIAEASFRKENPTVNEYCEKWLLIQKGRLRTTTYTDYEWKVKKYIQKPLGNKYMTDVTPDDVNLAILPALSMSESVYRSTQMLYKLIFTAAEDSNVIKKSPCSKLSAKGGKPQKVKKALSDEQVEKLLTAIKDLPPYVFVMIGLYCGLRREEILALQWDCVFLDVPAPYLSVKRAWHTEHNRPVILDELKTSAAKRDIPIPPPLADCLKEVKAKSQSPFVVANRDGEPLSYTQFQRVWKYIVTRSNKERTYVRYVNGQKIKHTVTPVLGEKAPHNGKVVYSLDFQVTPHQLRHTYAGQEVEITETSASFYNQRQKVQVTLNKLLEQDETFGIGMNGEISAVTFGLYAQEDITAADGSVISADGLLEIVSVGENGQATCATDLPFGSFYLKELSTDSHYLLNGETFPFTFEYGGPSVAVVEIAANDGEAITNELIRGEIHGLKTDENGTGLGGAVIGLFRSDETEFTAENALATTTSADDGSFSFSDVPYGNWVLKELESPEGFVLSDEIFSVTIEEDGQVVEISLANERVYGDLRLTKVDKDYPDNKLTGAEFEVYRDTNGNKELDEGDELLGKLEETSTGIYEMSHILYGGVSVKETKAPEGYLLDENAYYVEITENGKIYEVENEAGKGFVNAAQTGSLRIEKTSSDGKVEGFSFRVMGANGYDQTFKTDSTGKIEITGLRVGDYTVSEVSDSASANYVLPADKTVTIFADKTTVAQMHNELRDIPKTGDESKPWLWMTLMGVSAAGAAVLGIAAYVSKRRKDEESAE